jgi:CubicO group peptidase (beta-lactamase class C family)
MTSSTRSHFLRRAGLALAALVPLLHGCGSGTNAVAPVQPPPPPPPDPPPGAVPDLAPLDDLLSTNTAIEAMGGGGAMLLIYQGEVIYRKSFGNFTTETVVPVASASKLVSAVLVAKLIDQGFLTADTPVEAWYDFTERNDPKAAMTVAQLFSHTAGLDHQPPLHRVASYPSMDASVEDILLRVPVLFEPGSTLYYAGVGMQIVGGMAQRATGRDWQNLWQAEIGEPLRMTSTDYLGYVSGNVEATDNPNVAGSVQTNIDDYGNLLQMIYDGGVFEGRRVLSEAAVDLILTNLAAGDPVLRTPFDGYFGLNPDVGLFRTGLGNWLIDSTDPGATKPAFMVSGGAFGCNPFIDFERGLIGVYLPFNTAIEQVDEDLFQNAASTLYYGEIWPLLQNLFPVL